MQNQLATGNTIFKSSTGNNATIKSLQEILSITNFFMMARHVRVGKRHAIFPLCFQGTQK